MDDKVVNIEELKKVKEELEAKIRNAEVKEIVPEEADTSADREQAPPIDCLVQIVMPRNGNPVVTIQGSLVTARGLLEHAVSYVKERERLYWQNVIADLDKQEESKNE